MAAGRFSPKKEKSLLPVWSRPDSYRDVVVAHLPFVLLTGLALLLPFWVPLRSLPLIRCTFLKVTGFPCPFCGFTRSFRSIQEGNIFLAVYNCPISLVIYEFVILFFVWHMAALLMRIKIESGCYRLCRSRRLWRIIGIVFFCNWVYRISLGMS
ncbi:conserved hypothetical protein [delta proteobacterium NaphS2]|nr:conserved hypothetical protein [delta proteobacterium NaphS2]